MDTLVDAINTWSADDGSDDGLLSDGDDNDELCVCDMDEHVVNVLRGQADGTDGNDEQSLDGLFNDVLVGKSRRASLAINNNGSGSIISSGSVMAAASNNIASSSIGSNDVTTNATACSSHLSSNASQLPTSGGSTTTTATTQTVYTANPSLLPSSAPMTSEFTSSLEGAIVVTDQSVFFKGSFEASILDIATVKRRKGEGLSITTVNGTTAHLLCRGRGAIINAILQAKQRLIASGILATDKVPRRFECNLHLAFDMRSTLAPASAGHFVVPTAPGSEFVRYRISNTKLRDVVYALYSCGESADTDARIESSGCKTVQYTPWKLNLYATYHMRTVTLVQSKEVQIPILQRIRLLNDRVFVCECEIMNHELVVASTILIKQEGPNVALTVWINSNKRINTFVSQPSAADLLQQTEQNELLEAERSYWRVYLPQTLGTSFQLRVTAPSMQRRASDATNPSAITSLGAVAAAATTSTTNTSTVPTSPRNVDAAKQATTPQSSQPTETGSRWLQQPWLGLGMLLCVLLAFFVYQWLDASSWQSVALELAHEQALELASSTDHLQRLLGVVGDLELQLDRLRSQVGDTDEILALYQTIERLRLE